MDYEVTSPDGKKFIVSAPEGATQEQVLAYAQQNMPTSSTADVPQAARKGLSDHATDYAKWWAEGARDAVMGRVKGAADIGSTLLSPLGYLKDKVMGNASSMSDLVTGQKPQTSNEQRRASLDNFFKDNADPNSVNFKTGELMSNLGGTGGVGSVLAKGARFLGGGAPLAEKIATGLETGGFRLGGAPAETVAGKFGEQAIRAGTGATVGGASAGLVNPNDSGAGSIIGGVTPGAIQVAAKAGQSVASQVSPQVAALYQKAKDLGIDIPVDRIVNSRPMNALASSLNYVPLSGRAGTEQKMYDQLNTALSRTFGQESTNVTAALRKANTDLGQKFESTLSQNGVKVDQQFLDDLVAKSELAKNELGDEGARIINKQIDLILEKADKSTVIDGQTAYNIKKTLDRIGNRNSNEAFYAKDLKKSLMEALNRSLGAEEAAAFATTRRQYGNMLELEKLASNGAEGGISVARLANLKNINNQELQDIADIAAQFVRTRESPHGAMQRVFLGFGGAGLAGATGNLPLLAGGIATGRLANTALNSDAAKSLVLNQSGIGGLLQNAAADPVTRGLLYFSGGRASP